MTLNQLNNVIDRVDFPNTTATPVLNDNDYNVAAHHILTADALFQMLMDQGKETWMRQEDIDIPFPDFMKLYIPAMSSILKV
jgi:hypothetical protein